MSPNPQYVVLFHHFRRFLEAAADARIDVAPLKGAHLLTAAYPAGGDRGMISDIDFLVRDGQWRDALRVAERIGWTRRPSAKDEAASHEVGFHCALGDGRWVLFEAHRALFEPRRFPIDHGALWGRATAGTLEGAPCARLAPEDHFAHVAFHEVIHRLSTLERTLRDLELLIAAGPVDTERLFERAREWGVTRAVWLMLSLLAERRPDLEPVARRDAVAPKRAAGIAARWAADLAVSGALRLVHHRASAVILWPVLFDSKARLARFVLNHPSAAGA